MAYGVISDKLQLLYLRREAIWDAALKPHADKELSLLTLHQTDTEMEDVV